MIYFGIPSYRRADKQATLDYLESLGVNKKQIIVSVQDEQDREAYTKAGVPNRVGAFLYAPKKNLSGNANTILLSLPEGSQVVIMDDDIKNLSCLNGKALSPIKTGAEFTAFLEYGYGIARKHGTIGFSVYPCHNAYFMSDTYNVAHIGEGTFLALTAEGTLFDEAFDTKCDYELTSRIVRKYGAYPRLNMVSCNAPHYTKGGCETNWSDKQKVARDARMLVSMYPNFVKMNKARANEVLTIPRRDKIKTKGWRNDG